MKHTLRSRVLAVLLSLALLVGLMPGTVFAAGTDTGKAIQLGTSGIAGYDSAAGYDYIYFGRWPAQEDTHTPSAPIKWRVLDDQTNTQNEGLFLLSDVLLGTGTHGGVYFDNSGSNSNVWQKSTAQTWCKNFYSNNFSSKEQNAVLETTKSDAAFTSSKYNFPFAASENILNGDKVFFLSAEEAENSAYGFTDDNARIANYGNSAGYWWLRSPNANYTYSAGLVRNIGHVYNYNVNNARAARPAFNLDLNSVLFTSAAEGGKSSAAASGGNQGGEAADAIFEIDDYSGNEWKLTLLDSSRNFSVTEETASGKPGDTITLNYTGATVYNADTAPNEYISVIIADDSGAQYYGRITQPTSASGQVKITIPASLADGTYTLNVFSEQYNGGENDDTKLTDYASAFEAVTLTVDTTAPTLSNVSAIRDSETTATVKFTSSEAGSYYYEVVNSGENQPTIDTAGTGTTCDTTEQTIFTSLAGAGAKDIYIVVKDAAGNVSQPLKITIPAIYTLTVNLNGGSGNTTGGVYPAGEVINIDAGSRSNYRFNGWTSSNSGAFADASSASTTFTMPAADTTITAAWSYVGGGSTTDYYRLTFDTNGGSEIASIRRAEHTTIDLSGYTPTREGYEFSGWYADKDLTEKITSIRLTGNATVYAGWEEIKENPFTDVAENDWFYDDVIFVFSNDLMLGTSDTTFNPYGTTTRAMVVTTLWRMDGEPQQEGDNPFTDVKNGEWYTDAIIWANENGITTGYGNNLFGTNDPVTREQLVAFFYRYAEYKGYDTTITGSLDRFADKDDVSPWAKDAMAWAVGYEIFGGRDHDKLAPQDNATRAEFAAMLHRFCERN